MIGLILAAVGGIGVYKMVRYRRRGGFPGRLAKRLNATLEQELALRQAAEEVRQAMSQMHPRARMSALATALTAENIDREQLRQEMTEKTGQVQDAVLNAVERLRGSLDAGQRQKLANMMLGGGRHRCRAC